jgi:hypothetical protein
MMDAIGRILGFDARETDEELGRTPMSEEVRERFLLRPEIPYPLSIDRLIWPTHFSYRRHLWNLVQTADSSLIDADPDYSDGLWLDLDRMKQSLCDHTRPATSIAVELFAPLETTVEQFPSSLIYRIPNPRILSMGTTFLGYDVADAGFWSGLSNCGYDEVDLSALRQEWARRINDQGLLITMSDALEFKELSNIRVSEHAPFWVYGIHRLTD